MQNDHTATLGNKNYMLNTGLSELLRGKVYDKIMEYDGKNISIGIKIDKEPK